MEPEGSLSYPEDPTTGRYAKPYESNLHPKNRF
jgi:hypothetical protein